MTETEAKSKHCPKKYTRESATPCSILKAKKSKLTIEMCTNGREKLLSAAELQELRKEKDPQLRAALNASMNSAKDDRWYTKLGKNDCIQATDNGPDPEPEDDKRPDENDRHCAGQKDRSPDLQKPVSTETGGEEYDWNKVAATLPAAKYKYQKRQIVLLADLGYPWNDKARRAFVIVDNSEVIGPRRGYYVLATLEQDRNFILNICEKI